MSGIIVDNTGKSSGLVKASSTGAGVSWQSSIQTSNFTAENGKGYFIDTSSSAITVTLPSSPTAGDLISFKDYAGTFATNNLTIARNDEKIQGVTANSIISTNKASITCLYVDSAEGWVFTQEYNTANLAKYIIATGGTITESGDYKIHTFNSSGTFSVVSAGDSSGSNTVDYMVVAGGGGSGSDLNRAGGGGGAGGFRESVPSPAAWTASPIAKASGALPVSVQDYPITVGGGGSAGPAAGSQGSNSVFSTITSAGGGGGAAYTTPGTTGGSGGGGSLCRSGSAGNTPPTSPPQGNGGGNGINPGSAPTQFAAGGGGGATQTGGNAPTSTGPTHNAGDGGDGATTSISGSPTAFAGGGGGGAQPNGNDYRAGSGGTGGGGDGAEQPNSNPGIVGTAGTANTGGGGGGSAGGSPTTVGAVGGSGKVIIRYKYQN